MVLYRTDESILTANNLPQPAGGCIIGQIITVPFNPRANESPTLGWKDDIFDCTKFGFIHPSFLTACCCPLILMGQIMTRLKLDWLAKEAPDGTWKDTFRRMIYITIGYFILHMVLAPTDPSIPSSLLYNFVMLVYTVYLVYLVAMVRKKVRERDQIAEETCIGCEDVVCAFWCGCCTISQLARQTADYELDNAQFLAPDGLTSAPPVMDV
jgi:Cys-rich protein (TIGR01571 family)